MSERWPSILNTINHMICGKRAHIARVGRPCADQEGMRVEVHFGKPVIARVKKCRVVVVRKRHQHEAEQENCSER